MGYSKVLVPVPDSDQHSVFLRKGFFNNKEKHTRSSKISPGTGDSWFGFVLH